MRDTSRLPLHRRRHSCGVVAAIVHRVSSELFVNKTSGHN
jgi:hypothetical protein